MTCARVLATDLLGATIQRMVQVLYVEGDFSSRCFAAIEFTDGVWVRIGCEGDGDIGVHRDTAEDLVFEPPLETHEVAGVHGRITSVCAVMDWEGEVTLLCAGGVLVLTNWGDQLLLTWNGERVPAHR